MPANVEHLITCRSLCASQRAQNMPPVFLIQGSHTLLPTVLVMGEQANRSACKGELKCLCWIVAKFAQDACNDALSQFGHAAHNPRPVYALRCSQEPSAAYCSTTADSAYADAQCCRPCISQSLGKLLVGFQMVALNKPFDHAANACQLQSVAGVEIKMPSIGWSLWETLSLMRPNGKQENLRQRYPVPGQWQKSSPSIKPDIATQVKIKTVWVMQDVSRIPHMHICSHGNLAQGVGSEVARGQRIHLVATRDEDNKGCGQQRGITAHTLGKDEVCWPPLSQGPAEYASIQEAACWQQLL
eukprot:scaffold298603_cov21-Tisochrysis_lutea.AAC.1